MVEQNCLKRGNAIQRQIQFNGCLYNAKQNIEIFKCGLIDDGQKY